jgi:hypothetical protein
MLNPRFFPAVLALAMASSSCFFRKTTTVFTPPPARSSPQPQTPVEAALPPAPPDIQGDPMAALPELPPTVPQTLDPPRPVPPPRRGSAPAPPKAAAAGSVQPADTPAPPQLGQIFTPDQAREYNRILNESLERVRKNMAVVAGKNLNAEQSEIANRIRTFERQAEQAREQDLVTAVSLARRADLLAQDLLERLP